MEEQDSVREHIIESSKTVFQQYGYTKATMQDIADAAGKGRSTVYYYFQNKMEVFEAVVEGVYKEIIYSARQSVRIDLTFYENLLSYNRIKLNNIVAKVRQYHSLLDDLKENPDFAHQINRFENNLDKTLYKQILTWGVENGDIAEMKEEDMDFLAFVLVTALSSLEKELILYGSIEEMTSRIEWLSELLAKGLS